MITLNQQLTRTDKEMGKQMKDMEEMKIAEREDKKKSKEERKPVSILFK